MSRQDVLALLREQEGAFVSGEEISHRLGLSRAAIWKAVDALRREGYTVEARTGRGYRLLDAPDVLTAPEIRRFLGETVRVGRTLVCLAEVDSTNLRARQLAAEGAADGTVVVADRQTAGRGRLGRSFQSPGGQGIYLTALLRPDLPPERLSPVTAMAGVAVCRAVERLCGVSPGLKWPNDPVLDGKKLCGILTELSLEGETARVQELVLGIGINVSQRPEDFTPEVREIATSLVQALGHAVSRPALAAEIIREVDRLCAALAAGETGPYLAEYRRRCVNLGRTVRLLRPDGGRTPDEEGAGRENPLVHLLKIHWFNFTLPLFSTCTVLLRPSPHVTTNSNGTLVETVTAGVSSADLRARTLRSTTPSGPNG